MTNKNVLVFPCGTEIGLEINNALRFSKFITLYGASSEDDNGRLVYKNYIPNMPYITANNFITELNIVIKKYNIDYIFPAHDSVVLELSKRAKEINAEVITSDYATCEICRSKLKTYEIFEKDNITPRVYNSINEIEQYPIFIKPDVGQGSVGASLIKDKNELEVNLNSKNEKMAILEYLPGKEFTVDCFSDKNNNLIYCSMRERIKTRNGISVHCKTMKLEESVNKIAKIINNKLKFRGMWFFQVKLDANNRYKLLEVAPRIAGTMCLHRNSGVNFELMSIFDRLGYELNIIPNQIELEVERALINRFKFNYEYSTVYIDFDDTITNKKQINQFVMMFLYQCINQKKKIILITKHVNNVRNTLMEYKICENIFDDIIEINKEDEKSKYIKFEKATIFIDDSFKEREDIAKKIGIPCFDLDAIEALIDWRF